jgi:manganese/zinc/iron transport system permease protein
MTSFIPPHDFHRIWIEPWTESFAMTFWVVVMGALVGTACGWIGVYLLLRRMALVGDAISHSILPGLVVAFLIFSSTSTPVMFLGALGAGAVTVFLIEVIHRQSRVKVDAAICTVFTTLFAIGVVMIHLLEEGGSLHLDAECVLFGEIAFVALEPPWVWAGITWGPPPVIRMALVTLGVGGIIVLFYKELLITSFDAALAKSLGFMTGFWHALLMAMLSIVVVSAFESVGAILAVAMLVVPGMFAAQLSDRLPTRFLLVVIHSIVSAVLGYHLSIWLNCSTAGAIVVVGAILFVIAWLLTALTQNTRKSFPAEASPPSSS